MKIYLMTYEENGDRHVEAFASEEARAGSIITLLARLNRDKPEVRLSPNDDVQDAWERLRTDSVDGLWLDDLDLPEIFGLNVDGFSIMSTVVGLARLKYGNLDADVDSVITTAEQLLAGNVPALPDATAAVLRNAAGAISELDAQIGQMEGNFSDSDGTIAQSRRDGDDAQRQITAFLSGTPVPPPAYDEWGMSGPEEGDTGDMTVFVTNSLGEELIRIETGDVESDRDLGREVADAMNRAGVKWEE